MSASLPAAPSPTLDLKVRAAWLYYVEGLTQEQIAQSMSVSRAKVVRLLAGARDDAIVSIRVGAKGSEQIALERRLIARFGLDEAIVVPGSADDANVDESVGAAAGLYLREQARERMSIGVGWGATLSVAARAAGTRALAGVSVVSLLGGMTHSRAVNPSAVARRLADAFAAQCHQLTAPLVVSTEAMREALWNEPSLNELRARAQRIDLALVSVGHMAEDATLFREGLLTHEQRTSLVAAGAVGDVLCRFLDCNGRPVDHALNRRVIAIDPAELRAGRLVVASGGARKVVALRAALKALRANVLVTDESAAQGLLA